MLSEDDLRIPHATLLMAVLTMINAKFSLSIKQVLID